MFYYPLFILLGKPLNYAHRKGYLMNDMYLLKCNSICKTYFDMTKKNNILKNISLRLKKGDMMSITGASGSGKSTLLHIIGGLDLPDSGKIFF